MREAARAPFTNVEMLFWRSDAGSLCEVDFILENDQVLQLHLRGHISFATFMTAVPLSIVTIRMSFPGQSTNEKWCMSFVRCPRRGRAHGDFSSLSE